MSLCTAISLLVLLGPAQDEAPIAYRISFDNAAHHEASVTITYSELPPADLELRMSRTSPGRYALHDFARHVYESAPVVAAGRR